MSSKSVSRRKRTVPLLALLVFTALAATAQAVHWPLYGGDAGRSGYQPVEEPALPLTTPGCGLTCTVWEDTTAVGVRTSIITSAGGQPDVQVLAAGTEAGADVGSVRLRGLDNGTPAFNVVIDDGVTDDADTFGSGIAIGEYRGMSSQGVTPADTSVAGGLGQIFAVHNDDGEGGELNDIQIARINEADGVKGSPDFVVPNTDGFTVTSSPLVTGSATLTGTRSLFFLATNATQTETRLYKVVITNAGLSTASPSAAPQPFVVVPGGNPISSPTLYNVGTDPAMPTAYIAVGAGPDQDINTPDVSVRTYRASDLTPGPTSGDLGDDATTPIVPLQGNGVLAPQADALYVEVGQNSNQNTIVYKLVPTADALALNLADQSPLLEGIPSALALDQEDNAAGPGRLAATTGSNLFTLDGNLDGAKRLDFESDLQPLSTGFARTTAAVSNDLAYVTRDNGEQLVVDLGTADLVSSADFDQDDTNNGSAFAYGQPSISRRFVQYGSNLGLFVYRGTAGTFNVSDATVTEGDTGTRTLTFTITRSGSTADAQSVIATTAAGTATENTDYVGKSQTIAFAAGQDVATFDVVVNGDLLDEPDETLSVNLAIAPAAAGGGAVLGDASGTGTIADNDGPEAPAAPPTFSIGDVTANEGNSATTAFTFTVTKSGAGAGSVTATTADGNATAGSDYTAVSQVLTFAANETTKTVTVLVNGDTTPESEETFKVNLSAATGGATIGDGDGLGRIVNDDGVVTGPGQGSAYVFPRVDPQRFTAKTTPRRDRTRPYRFRTTGRLTPPASVGSAGCSGRVSVQYKKGRATTISTRRTSIRSNCTFASTVTFSSRERLGRTGRLTVTVRFLGNTRLRPARVPQYTVRAG